MRKLIVFLLLVGLLQSCEEDKNNEPAPELPPQFSMVMDYSAFTTNKNLDVTAFNWGYSALNLAVWNTILTVNLAIPVAAFVESFNHEGEYNEEINGWKWNYSFTAAGANHTAELEATLVSEGVQWEMFIRLNNGDNRFLWFSGISSIDRTHGEWELNYNAQNPTNYLDIEWNYNYTDSTGDIKYTIVDPNNEQVGSFIEYGLTTSTPYDAYYDISLTKEQKFTEIEWNITTIEGRVKDEVHFGDTDWHCWDSDLQDIDCQ